METPTDTTVQAWVQLVRAHQEALSYIESALKSSNYPPLIWYDILLELEHAGTDGLRPFELEHALLLRQYGVSRLVERIEKAGYLVRKSCLKDGRGQSLHITQSGKTLRQHMWEIYGPAIEKAIGSKLSDTQTKTLSELLGKLRK